MRFSGLKTNESDNDGGDGLPDEYFPTTMYEDYALNEFLFCMKIMLFVREQNRDEYGLAMSYVFLGEASFVKSYGARPMSIEWRLAEPIPAGLLKESRKLVG